MSVWQRFIAREWPHGCRCHKCNRLFEHGDLYRLAPWGAHSLTPVCSECEESA